MRCIVLFAAVAIASAPGRGADAMAGADHVVVTYSGIDATWAQAVARCASAARAAAIEHFAFDMPETVRIQIRCDAKARVRLYTDGRNSFFLTIRSAEDLRRPAVTGIFQLYGLCHETGHVAMYRVIRNHRWMTGPAAEGWAHYLGSRLVDLVHAREGESLWPDRYDSLADGTRRMKRQLAGRKLDPTARAAKLWGQLAKIVGDKKIVTVFRAWAAAKIDFANPGATLGKALPAIGGKKRQLAKWSKTAEPLFVQKVPRSGFAVRTARPGDLTGQPAELAHDDGKPAAKRSIAGGGHAVRFQTAGLGWYLTGVKIYATRYGRQRPPREKFHIWLCDKDFKTIADFPLPYAKFQRGRPKWVSLPIRPTEVPREFILCIAFNPTRTKGVFVYHDRNGGGMSLAGLPGRGGGAFARGDWLLRATVDQLKTADALRSPAKPGRRE